MNSGRDDTDAYLSKSNKQINRKNKTERNNVCNITKKDIPQTNNNILYFIF